MFRLFKDAAQQDRFERDGFVHLPLLEPEDVECLRAHYADFSNGGRVVNSAYGMFISLDGEELELKKRTIALIRQVVLPRAERYVHDCKTHLGSYLVKVPNPTSYTYPHQDWTFIDNERMDYYFSMTVWIALGDYDREGGSIGFVKGSHRFFNNVNCSPSPATRTPTQGLEPVLFRHLTFPEMRAGDAVAFNNKTIHAALPNRSGEQRIAVGIGLTPLEAEIYHYFLKPGTTDRLLKLKVDEDFFLHYNNEKFQALWESGKVPEHCTVVGELPHRLDTMSAEELERLCLQQDPARQEVPSIPAAAAAPRPEGRRRFGFLKFF
jgi:hypothetical protein